MGSDDVTFDLVVDDGSASSKSPKSSLSPEGVGAAMAAGAGAD